LGRNKEGITENSGSCGVPYLSLEKQKEPYGLPGIVWVLGHMAFEEHYKK
jgi:hypothetical protein